MFADKYIDESTTQLSIFLLVQENSSCKDTRHSYIMGMCRTLPFRNEGFHINLFKKKQNKNLQFNVAFMWHEMFLTRSHIIPVTNVHLSVARKSEVRKTKGKYLSQSYSKTSLQHEKQTWGGGKIKSWKYHLW